MPPVRAPLGRASLVVSAARRLWRRHQNPRRWPQRRASSRRRPGRMDAASLATDGWRASIDDVAARAAERIASPLARAALCGIFAALADSNIFSTLFQCGYPRTDAMNAADADALLIERVKRGDVKAFEMLVVKYQRRIERLIGRMVRDVDLVPDIAQETFIRAYRAIPQFRGDSAFYTWLYRIAVNTAKKTLVDMKRDPIVLESSVASRDEDDETSRVENELTDGETPEAILASKEIAAAVNGAIEALSVDLRQAITLREIEGLSYEEIADVMNCPIGTVRSRIFRAREAIAERLRPLLDTRHGGRW